jgi:hypothetical protein
MSTKLVTYTPQGAEPHSLVLGEGQYTIILSNRTGETIWVTLSGLGVGPALEIPAGGHPAVTINTGGKDGVYYGKWASARNECPTCRAELTESRKASYVDTGAGCGSETGSRLCDYRPDGDPIVIIDSGVPQ